MIHTLSLSGREGMKEDVFTRDRFERLVKRVEEVGDQPRHLILTEEEYERYKNYFIDMELLRDIRVIKVGRLIGKIDE